MNQSPIKLQAGTALQLADPRTLFECRYQQGKIKGCFEGDEGHGHFALSPGQTLPKVHFRGADYELRQIHLHQGSEHVVEHDDPQDLELHFVHAPAGSPVASPLVVIGVLYSTTSGKAKPSPTDQAMRILANAKPEVCVELDPFDLFPRVHGKSDPDTMNWFHYEGSLTSGLLPLF